MGISDSRFHMWRAVVALAHADGRIAPEEKDLVNGYLAHVPFTSEQKEILQDDMTEPQDMVEMFDRISAPEDQGEFFEFARMMNWCDGDYDSQEEKIFERLKSTQMHRVNPDKMRQVLQETRDAQRIQEAAEDAAFRAQAQKNFKLGAFLKFGRKRT